MYTIIKEQQNAIILLHEIYGINQHIRDAANYLVSCEYDIYCPDLLGIDSHFNYHEQDRAYDYFMNEVTIEIALKKVQKIIDNIKKDYHKIVVIGYSVGATIAWLCSINKYCNGVIGFYGSIIRNYCDIEPICPVLLYFAEKEKSFKVRDLISRLVKKENTKVLLFKGEHGFADRFCQNYNEVSFNKTQKLTKQFLKGIEDNRWGVGHFI
jgi:dienelactone hydrolase